MERQEWTNSLVDRVFSAQYERWIELSHKSSPFHPGNPKNAAVQTAAPKGTMIILEGQEIDLTGWTLRADPYGGVDLDVGKKLEKLARDRGSFELKAKVLGQVWAHALKVAEYASAWGACADVYQDLEFPGIRDRSTEALEALVAALTASALDILTADKAE